MYIYTYSSIFLSLLQLRYVYFHRLVVSKLVNMLASEPEAATQQPTIPPSVYSSSSVCVCSLTCVSTAGGSSLLYLLVYEAKGSRHAGSVSEALLPLSSLLSASLLAACAQATRSYYMRP